MMLPARAISYAFCAACLFAPALGFSWPSIFQPRIAGQLRASNEPERPEWPAQYEISWQFLVPYVSRLQSTPLIYNYTVYQDSEHGRQKIVRNSVETTMEVVDSNTMYEIYPRIDEMRCNVHKISDGLSGISSSHNRKLLQVVAPQLGFVLPNLTESRWSYNGTATMHGQEANTWVMYDKKEMGYGNIVSTYTMYVGKDNTPLQLHMWGVDLYMNSHFDDWIVDINSWRPGTVDEGNWAVPHFCKQSEAQEMQRHHLDSSLAMEVARQMPNPHHGDEHYDAFVHKHSRRHLSKEEYQQRSQRFHEVKGMVEDHNSKLDHSHKLAVNRFADWHKEEFLATILPNHGKPRTAISPEGKQPLRHENRVPEHMLPSTLDWRGTGADSPVKDQASCGSCWAFGTIGPIETAYFRETGKQVLFSEQDLMDCGWYLNNKACLGGYQDIGLQWLLDQGRVATEEAYPYQGAADFCSSKGKDHIKFSGDFVLTDGTEYGLKEALFTKGPMTVSVDAAPDSFVFYSSGVYNNSECKSDYGDLDHAVLVSGYGTTDEGHDYWLVKNTWSSYWGDKGYIKIARSPHDCGIATQPMYVDLKLKQADKARA